MNCVKIWIIWCDFDWINLLWKRCLGTINLPKNQIQHIILIWQWQSGGSQRCMLKLILPCLKLTGISKKHKINPFHSYSQPLSYQDPAQADALCRVQKELDETKVVLHQTLEGLLNRGEKLDDLVSRSDMLSQSSKAFYTTARKTNSWCCTIMWGELIYTVILSKKAQNFSANYMIFTEGSNY